MTNVIDLKSRRQDQAIDFASLSTLFAHGRRAKDDVFWLKENAEWLGILANMDADKPRDAIAPYEEIYQDLAAKITFFPQYYRFFLSLCLDLEDLGLRGDQGAILCHWVDRHQFARAELSDLQRAEAERLLARRICVRRDPSLQDRLENFISRSMTFALPNKKAAYELAHIVFYLADYGQQDPRLSDAAHISLDNAGLLAFLDQDADLLGEICAAKRLAGEIPDKVWESFVCQAHNDCRMGHIGMAGSADGYHTYLVSGWLAQMTGRKAFERAIPAGKVAIHAPAAGNGALCGLSQALFDYGRGRSADWGKMRARLIATMPEDGQAILEAAERSTYRFDAFFEGFSRAADNGNGLIYQ